jgi:tetratricopeptide (TPR) repeat protein
MAHCVYGVIYQGLFDLGAGREHLENAFALAKEIGSLYWLRVSSAFLASICIAQNDLSTAAVHLNEALPEDDLDLTASSRLCRCARVELALAENAPSRALEIIDSLAAGLSGKDAEAGSRPILRLEMLRGRAYKALGRLAEAETALQAAGQVAETQGARARLWRILADLGDVFETQGEIEAANQADSKARRIIEEIAARVPDGPLRDRFLERANKEI